MSTYIMRPAEMADFDAMMDLARLSGPGFTSLPVDEDIIAGRIRKSVASFGGKVEPADNGKYLMILEEAETGLVAGCSAVKCGVGVDQPFFNYRIITLAQASQAAERRFDMDALVLTNEFIGYTEVGTLFLKAEHRGGGVGRLVAQSRYLLMGTAPERFGDMVLAELRGVVDPDGTSPFWECLGRHFFRMSFQDADHLSALTDNQFILDLMPKYPIYIDLLPPEAREVIGRCHSEGVGAMKLLEWEGFRFEKMVDIFDGGPLLATPRAAVRTLRESRQVTVEIAAEVDDTPATGLISNDRLTDFRSAHLSGTVDDSRIILSKGKAELLRLKAGDTARIWERK